MPLASLCATTLNAQTDTATSTPHPSFATETPRQGQLFFSVGAEYRWAEHFTLPAQAQSFSRGIDTQDMNVGSVLFYTLDYYISERISLGFSHAFRYDHIADLGENSGDTQAIVPDQYGLIMDYHLYFELSFSAFSKTSVFRSGGDFTAQQCAHHPQNTSKHCQRKHVTGRQSIA